jgi:hypothetical protein
VKKVTERLRGGTSDKELFWFRQCREAEKRAEALEKLLVEQQPDKRRINLGRGGQATITIQVNR